MKTETTLIALSKRGVRLSPDLRTAHFSNSLATDNDLELLAHAETENDPMLRSGFENLAAAYLRLAEQAERNTKLVVEFELPDQNDIGDPKQKR